MGCDHEISDKEKAANSLLDCVRELEANNATNIQCMQELCRLAELCGKGELGTYMEKGIRDTERAILWMKAAISFLENQ